MRVSFVPERRHQLLPTGWLAIGLAIIAVRSAAVAGERAATFHVSRAGNDAWSGVLAKPNAEGSDGPFATLRRAQETLRKFRALKKPAGTLTVVVHAGRYQLDEPLTFTPADSGTAESPTRFVAAPGAKVILSGGVRVDGWQPGPNNVWTAKVPEPLAKQLPYVRHISVGGAMRHPPRLPRQGFHTITGLAGADPKGKYNTPANKFEFAPGEIDAAWKNLGDVEVVVHHFWVDTHLRIKSVDEDKRIVHFDRSSRRRLTDDYANRLARFYVRNVFEALTEPGQFYYDRPTGVLHYLPTPEDGFSREKTQKSQKDNESNRASGPVLNVAIPNHGSARSLSPRYSGGRGIQGEGGQHPSQVRHAVALTGERPGERKGIPTVVIPRLPQVVRFEGNPDQKQFVGHVELRGLTIADAAWEPPPGDAADSQSVSNASGAVVLRGARNCVIEKCRVVNVGGYGIELLDGSRANHIVRCEVTSTGAGGIKLTGGDARSPEPRRTGGNRITDNHLHKLGRVFHSGAGVLLMHADNNVVAHNHIHDLYYTGVSVGWVWGYGPSVARGNKIEFNRIHDVGQKMLSDMGGVYLLGVSPGTVVRGNVIHDIDAWNYGGWGIYTDEGSSGILIENNLVYRTKTGGFHQHYGKDNVVRNNIFALARLAQVERSRMEPHRSFTFERNIIYYKDGVLLDKNWQDDKFALDHNVYWNAAGRPVLFPGKLTFEAWRKRGFDKNSIIADPLFRAPEQGDFTLAPDSPARKVGFEPWDLEKAGPRRPGGDETEPCVICLFSTLKYRLTDKVLLGFEQEVAWCERCGSFGSAEIIPSIGD
jgi:parallel beta-helix repeat protein